MCALQTRSLRVGYPSDSLLPCFASAPLRKGPPYPRSAGQSTSPHWRGCLCHGGKRIVKPIFMLTHGAPQALAGPLPAKRLPSQAMHASKPNADAQRHGACLVPQRARVGPRERAWKVNPRRGTAQG
jgi:hypothetical protein